LDTEYVETEQPAQAIEPASSFADHEASFSNRPKLVDARQPAESPTTPAVPTPDGGGEAAAGERDQKGRYRAQSQRATVDDVPTISALTKEYHDALTEAGFTVEKKPGESDRVHGVRVRAELAKALRDLKRTPAAPAVLPSPSGPLPSFRPNGGDSGANELPGDFPAKPKPEDFNDYTDYVENLAEWKANAAYYRNERQREQRTQAQAFATSVQSRYAAAKDRYPDFEAVVLNPQTNSPIPRGSVIERFTFKHATGPDVVYHFFKHPDEVAAIHALPDADDQIATLSLLGQRLTSTSNTREQAVPTRSAAAPVTTPIVKPPNLVRTGVVKAGDEPPGDDASFAEHEKFFGTSKRRR